MTNLTPQQKMQNLANVLSIMFGKRLDITIRGPRNFTFSFEGCDNSAKSKIEKYFKKSAVKVWSIYDNECNLTCVYVNS